MFLSQSFYLPIHLTFEGFLFTFSFDALRQGQVLVLAGVGQPLASKFLIYKIGEN